MYGMETVAMTEKQEGKMEVAEFKMMRWALGVIRKDKMTNKYVRGTAKVAKLGDKLCGTRLHWHGHVKRREEDNVRKNDRDWQYLVINKKGGPKRRSMDLVREDMEMFGTREGDEVDRVICRRLSGCGYPEQEKVEKRTTRAYA